MRQQRAETCACASRVELVIASGQAKGRASASLTELSLTDPRRDALRAWGLDQAWYLWLWEQGRNRR